MNKRQIVLVEDDLGQSKMIQKLLQLEGHDVHIAHNGVDGLQTIRDTHPDLILTDLRLPQMNGWQLIEALKADISTSDIPIIAVSAPSGVDDIKKAYDLGANMFVQKPFSVTDLYREISGYLT